jgi:hypothetical protein
MLVGIEGGEGRKSTEKIKQGQIRTNVCQVKRAVLHLMEGI